MSKERTNQASSENWFEKRQRSETTESRHGGGTRGFVSGSFQHPRGSTSFQIDAHRKGPRTEQTEKV